MTDDIFDIGKAFVDGVEKGKELQKAEDLEMIENLREMYRLALTCKGLSKNERIIIEKFRSNLAQIGEGKDK